MKIKHLILVALLMSPFLSYAQQTDKWEKWKPLIGNWSGEGSGLSGEGTGTFSFNLDLNQNILIRKSNYHYVIDKTNIIFDDIMIIYLVDGTPSKAVFFNNDGFSRNYLISYSDKSITLISEKIPQTPIFKLTYTFIDDSTVGLKFEIARDGLNFIVYSEEVGKRQRSTSER